VDLGLPTCTSDASLYVRYTCINKKAYPTTSQSGIEESNDRKDQIILYILHLSSSPHPKHIRVMSSNQVPPLRSRNHTHTWTHSKRKIMKNEKSCRIEAHANASLKPPKKQEQDAIGNKAPTQFALNQEAPAPISAHNLLTKSSGPISATASSFPV
jgi:hypothetical protein